MFQPPFRTRFLNNDGFLNTRLQEMNMNFDNWWLAGQSMHMQRKPCDIIIIQDYLLMISFKVLSLIQSWAHAFSPDPDLRGVAEVILAHCLDSL